MSELPISCFRCRRRKIKCNKRKPCNQCFKQKVPCHFPSKFRNVSYEESQRNDTEHSGSTVSGSTDLTSATSPSDVHKLEEQIRRLEMENQHIRQQFQQKIGGLPEESENDEDSSDGCRFSGETTEKGEKYYGPLLSNNMTEDFDKISNLKGKMSSTAALKKHSWTAEPFKIAESDQDSDTTSSNDVMAHYNRKEPLPWVVGKHGTAEHNTDVIIRLVRYFFDTKTYDYFISEQKVLRFVDDYASIPDLSWEGTDDLLLLHMVLILAIQRLNPTRYNELGRGTVSDFPLMWKAIKPLKHKLHSGFSNLRHNLVNESYVTVQAYILCTEWEFMEQRYEESWSMMFHCCAIAYAIGLHVVSKSSSSSFDPIDAEQSEQKRSKDGYDDYFVDELPKLRVWFALRNLNSQMCSILGRPNPIMIQVNTVSLPTTSISNVEDAQKLNNLTNSQLKLGLSECVRLSNSNMIENFLIKICMDNVWSINQQYSEEIDKLSYYLSAQYENLINGVVKKIDSLTDMPTTITRKDVLIDLVVLHVNRVKLLEPFVDQLPPNQNALNYIMGSILLFYEHTCELVSEFVKSEIPRILESGEAKDGEIRLDKVFIYRDPFFASFIYQGIVVTFILISVKANDFIQDNNGDFISRVEGQLQMLLGLHSSISKLVKENIHLWSRNNIFLMRKTLDHITIMKQVLKDRKSNKQMNQAFSGFDYDPQVAEMLGSNLKDPFWVENPENSANFLGITEDRDESSLGMNNNATNIVLGQSQTNKLRVSAYSGFDDAGNVKMEDGQLESNPSNIPLYVQDPMINSSRTPFDQMQAPGDFGEEIDIDGQESNNYR